MWKIMLVELWGVRDNDNNIDIIEIVQYLLIIYIKIFEEGEQIEKTWKKRTNVVNLSFGEELFSQIKNIK